MLRELADDGPSAPAPMSRRRWNETPNVGAEFDRGDLVTINLNNGGRPIAALVLSYCAGGAARAGGGGGAGAAVLMTPAFSIVWSAWSTLSMTVQCW